jgi:hypothetical protein
VRVRCAGDDGACWREFSAAALTSFAGLERIVRAYAEDADVDEADVAAAVAAAKYAAAIGCADAEVQAAAWRAYSVSTRAIRWRAARDGADEPVAWLTRVLRDGRISELLNAPDATHDVSAWLPQMDEAGPGISLAHLYAFYRKLDKVTVQALGGRSMAFILYTFLYHLAGGANCVLAPSQQSEKVLKSLYTRVGRQLSSHEEERARAAKRRDQSCSRGSVETYYRALAEVRMLDRQTRLLVCSRLLLHMMPECVHAEKENPPVVVRPPCLKRARPEQCGGSLCAHGGGGSCPLCDWPGVTGHFHCGAAVGMCMLCAGGACCGAELVSDEPPEDRLAYYGVDLYVE